MQWHKPVPDDAFNLTREFLYYAPEDYRITKVHPGVDYGRSSSYTDTPLYACADGVIIYRQVDGVGLGEALGNHFSLYVPAVNRSFIYCHMKSAPPGLRCVVSGTEVGVMGETGFAHDIHLHLEGFYGRFDGPEKRTLKTKEDVTRLFFDAHAFIKQKIGR